MKKILYTFLFMGLLQACSINDDPVQLPPIVVNQFCYGVDTAQIASVNKSFYREAAFVASGVYKTDLLLTSQDFMVSDTDEIDGAGFLIDVDLNGNLDEPLQTGIYSIASGSEFGKAQLTYYEDFDTAVMLNAGINLESGIVVVRPYRTGYFIEIDAVDSEGNEFHGSFLGNSTLIL